MAFTDFRDHQDRIELHHGAAGVAGAQEVADFRSAAVENPVEGRCDIDVGQLFARGAQAGPGGVACGFGGGNLVGRAVTALAEFRGGIVFQLTRAQVRFGLLDRSRARVDVKPAQDVTGGDPCSFQPLRFGDPAAGFRARDDLPEGFGVPAQGQAGRAHPGLDRTHHNLETVAGFGLFGVRGGGAAIEQRPHSEQEDHGDENGEGGDIGTVHVTTGLPASDWQACLRKTVFTCPSRYLWMCRMTRVFSRREMFVGACRIQAT